MVICALLVNDNSPSLQLLLFQAERAWSYAQELLSLAAFPANAPKASALRHNATGRFRRAVHWATQLLSQCQVLYDAGRLGSENLLEMAAYTLVLNGRFLRYRDEFEDALVQLSVARAILDELAESADTSRDQALATYFGDEIGPEIRYCAHELGRPKAYDVDSIVREQSAQHRAQIVDGYETLVQKLKNESGAESKGNERKLQPLLWEGEPVPVRNPELVDVLAKVQEGEVKLREESIEVSMPTQADQERKKRRSAKGGKSKRGVAAYDNILLALSDAEDVARKLAEAQKNVSNLLFSFTISLSRILTLGKRFDFYVVCARCPGHSLCSRLHRLSSPRTPDPAGLTPYLYYLDAELSGVSKACRKQDSVLQIPEGDCRCPSLSGYSQALRHDTSKPESDANAVNCR